MTDRIYFQDPSIPISKKVNSIEKDPEHIGDVIAEFEMFSSSVLEELLKELAISPKISNNQKLGILEVLFTNSESKHDLEGIISAYIPDIPVFEVKVIKWLLTFDQEKYLNRLYKYLANPKLADSVRYSLLTELYEDYPTVSIKGAFYFQNLSSVTSRFKILTSQFYLEHTLKTFSYKDSYLSIFKTLFAIANNPEEDYNIRADATDTLHHYGNTEIQKQSLQLLEKLGGQARSIFENKQNIHLVDITEMIELIKGIIPITRYAEISPLIIKMVDQKELKDRKTQISASLGRICLDVARYGSSKESWNSIEIMEKVWAYIQVSPLREELEKRLLEELEEMAETCSSGHAIRLLNVLSSFSGSSIKMTFSEQIIANFNGRITYRMTHIDNKEEQSEVLLDMVDKGPLYIKFYVKFLPLVIDELRKEFVPAFVTEDKFNEYIQEAISRYGSGR